MVPDEGKGKELKEAREAKRRYVKLAEFGLPESPYDTLKQILRAMGKLGGPGTSLTNRQIADTAGYTPRVVSGNNKFLLSTGVADRIGNKVSLTDRGAQLALALDYNDLAEAGRVWRSLVADNEFLKRILGALDIRGGKIREEFSQYIARTAQAPNRPQFIRGANAVIDVLQEAELIKEAEGDTIRVTPEYRALGAYEGEGEEIAEEVTEITPRAGPPNMRKVSVPAESTVQFMVNITVSITPSTTPEDIEAIGSRIRELRESVTKPQGAEDASDNS